jgi:hypothetical protein
MVFPFSFGLLRVVTSGYVAGLRKNRATEAPNLSDCLRGLVPKAILSLASPLSGTFCPSGHPGQKGIRVVCSGPPTASAGCGFHRSD